MGAAATVVVLAWLYRRLFRLYPRRRAAMLLVLKAAAALVLLAGLLRPALRREERDLSRARVLLLVDDSRSMSTADGRDGRTRTAEAARAVFKNLLPRLRKKLPVVPLAFAEEVRSLEKPEQLRATGPTTDIPRALSESARNYAAAGGVGAFVLVTDGGDAAALPAAFAERALRATTAPVFCLAVGSDLSETDDLRLERVEAPGRVDAKTDFEVTVEAVVSGRKAFISALGPVPLILSENGKQVAARVLRFSPGTRRRRVVLRTAAPEPGVHRYVLRLPKRRGEAATLNNERTFSVEVEDPALRVLYYAARLGQEYKPLRNALRTDPGLRFTGLVRLGPDRFLLQGARSADKLGNAFPASAETLRKFKCVILGGCPADELSPAAREALERWVREGGGLAFLGGPKAFGRGGWPGTATAPVFPWTLVTSEPPFRKETAAVEPTPLGRADPLFRDAAPFFASGRAKLTGFNLPGALRPGAQGLLRVVLPSGERPVVVAWARYGKGRVLGLAADTMWKWRDAGAAGAKAYAAFWRTAARRLAGREEGGGLLKLTADRKGGYRAGSRATVVARVLNRELKPHPDAVLHAVLKRLDGRGAPVRVPFSTIGGPGAYSARVDLDEEGAYRLRVTASDEKGVLETRELLLEVGAGGGEGAHLAVNTQYLEELADKTGGLVVPADRAAELAAAVLNGVKAEVRREELSLLWGTPFYFLLFLGLMSAEWILRRRMNLI